MRRTTTALLLAACAAPGAFAGAGSLELGTADFEAKVLKSNKFSFVKFLAPWCGHCKKLKPDWDRLGDFYNKADSKVQIVDVDCTTEGNDKLWQQHGVSGYPTIKYYSKETGEAGEKYEGERDYNKLKKFAKSMSKDPCDVTTLKNCNKKEKTFIEEVAAWDAAKIAEEKASMTSSIDAAKAEHQKFADLFEKQKEEAMATMKKQEEAKKEFEKLNKDLRYKLNLMEQKGGKKEEL